MNPHLNAALDYTRRGWAVFPLAAGQKVPRKDSRGLLEATRDSEIVKRWWLGDPMLNVGIATGERSGLFIVDVDPRHGGSDTYMELQKKYGRPPDTVTVATGGGGFQFYFRHVAGLRNSAGRLGRGVDTRGDGGYVVAPPSVHPSGGLYSFFEGRAPEEVAVAYLPDWIRMLATEPNDGGARVAAPPEYYRDLFRNGAVEGERNDALVRMAGHLIRKKLDPYLVLDILRLWNDHRFRPPGDPAKLEEIVDRVAGREYERIMKRRRG